MSDPEKARTAVEAASVRAVRPGHGANCSSIGSVVDTLFVTALLGGAVFAAVVAGLSSEPVEVVGKGADAGASDQGGDGKRADAEGEAAP